MVDWPGQRPVDRSRQANVGQLQAFLLIAAIAHRLMGKAVAVLASTGTAALLDAQEADLGSAIDPLAIDRAGGDGQCFTANDRCDQRRIAAGSQGDTLAIDLGHHRLALAATGGELDLVLDQIAADQCFWGGEADLVQEAIAPLERGGHFVDVETVTLEFAAFLDVDRGSRRRDGQCAAGRAGQGGCRNLRGHQVHVPAGLQGHGLRRQLRDIGRHRGDFAIQRQALATDTHIIFLSDLQALALGLASITFKIQVLVGICLSVPESC